MLNDKFEEKKLVGKYYKKSGKMDDDDDYKDDRRVNIS